MEHRVSVGRPLPYLCLALLVGLSSGCARLTRQTRRDASTTEAAAASEADPNASPHGKWNLFAAAHEPELAGTPADAATDGLGWELRRLPEIEFAEATMETATPIEPTIWQRGWSDVRDDQLNFYSPHNLALLGAGLGVAAALANTGADNGMRDFYQDNVRDASTDEYWESLHTPKFLGNGLITLPTFAGAVIVGMVLDDSPLAGTVGEWGERSLRAVLVGAPPLLLLQSVTGGSRPEETDHKSHWDPFQDNNGVSGHSFMGAVPFISAAQMTNDPWLKAFLYTASTAAGLSRINDDGHYPSQVLLGWWLAYLATSSVGRTELAKNVTIVPLPVGGGSGIGAEYRW